MICGRKQNSSDKTLWKQDFKKMFVEQKEKQTGWK